MKPVGRKVQPVWGVRVWTREGTLATNTHAVAVAECPGCNGSGWIVLGSRVHN